MNRLTTHLTVTFLVLALGPLIALGALLGATSYRSQIESEHRYAESLSVTVAGKVEELLGSIEKDVLTVNRIKGFFTQSATEQREILLELLSSIPSIREITFIGADGYQKVRASSYKAHGPDEQRDLSGHEEVAAVLAGNGTAFGKIQVDPDVGDPLVSFALPLTDPRTGKIRGVMLCLLRLRVLLDLVADFSTPPDIEVFITASDGRILAAPEYSLALRGMRYAPVDEAFFEPGPTGASALAGTSTITLGKLTLNAVVALSRSEVLGPFYRSASVYAVVFLAALLSGVSLALLAKRRIVAPLLDLSKTALSIRNGDLTARAVGGTFLELQELAGTFNQMTDRLLGAMRALETEVATRKETELALYTSRERLDLALNAVSDGVWDWHMDTGHIYFSPRWFTMLGYEPDAFPGVYETWRSLLHPDDVDPAETAVREHLLTDNTFEIEIRMLAKSGEWTWIMARGQVVKKDAFGLPLRMVGTHVDITDRKLAEQQLADSRNFIRSILDSMPSAVIGLDAAGLINHWNASAQIMSGKTHASVMGRPLLEALPTLSGHMDKVAMALRDRSVAKVEKMPFQQGDDIRFTEIQFYPLMNNGVSGVVIRIDDVTEQVHLREMLVQSEKMMSVGGLAAGMAHEINNPLGAILQSAQVVISRFSPHLEGNRITAQECGCSLEAIIDYTQKRSVLTFLEGIREAGIRAARIVSNMLEFSRKGDPQHKPANINAILEKAVELALSDYDLKKKYDFKKIHITWSLAPDLPDVPCTRTEIEQVILNLLKNAAQAMAGQTDNPPPAIALRTRLEQDAIRIDVEDNGQGIPETVRKRVFEPFFTTKPVGEGTGLGLAVSYFIIVTNHGGRFDVQPAPERGTRFTLFLPLK